MIRILQRGLSSRAFPTLDFGPWTLDFDPSSQILLHNLLRAQTLSNENDYPAGELLAQKHGQERLGRGRHAGARQHAPLLQTPGKGLHGGSRQDSSEQ